MTTEVTELETAAAVQASAAVKDRRRPGRLEAVSPELIPMLRNADPTLEIVFEDVDQTAAVRGLCAGILFSVPIWAAIAYMGSRFLS